MDCGLDSVQIDKRRGERKQCQGSRDDIGGEVFSSATYISCAGISRAENHSDICSMMSCEPLALQTVTSIHTHIHLWPSRI